ncbi:MAG: DNA internalization-related competence protein ComEC/Rec2 [Deltaproteobacteria bacterium]|nr:DNA internalization-related competence protein ComEC/Rec2 [Deltaproteobacteria bacterium]
MSGFPDGLRPLRDSRLAATYQATIPPVSAMHPLFLPFLCFISGILLGDAFGFSVKAISLFFVISALPSVFLFILRRRFHPAAAAVPFVVLGALFIHPYSWPRLAPNHIRNYIAGPEERAAAQALPSQDVEGVILSAATTAGGRGRVIVEAERIMSGEGWVETVGKVALTLPEGLTLRPNDRIRFVARLREPANFGNPGEYDYKGRLNREGVFVTAGVSKPGLVVRTGEITAGALRRAWRVVDEARAGIRRFIRANALNAGALNALVIGDGSGLSPALREAFARTSTAHILAISGLHVGIVAAAFYWLILFLLKRSERLMLAYNVRKAALIACIAPVVIYGVLAGLPVSAARAVLMVCIFAVSFVINRGKDYWNTLALAGLVILAADPSALWDISFQLSFAAVAGIIYVLPRLREAALAALPCSDEEGRVRRFLRQRVLEAALVTAAASAATAPIIAYHFHRVSLTGLAANLVAVPLVTLIVPLLLAAAATSLVWNGLAAAVLFCADTLFSGLAATVKAFAGLPYSSALVSTPTPLELALYYVLIVSAVNMKRARVFVWLTPVVALVIIGDWGYWSYYARHAGDLKVTFVSVGQGESALVEFDHGSTMLIDGGGFYNSEFDTGERIVAPFLWQKKISRLDYIILSHPQRDHMAGLKFLAEAFRPREFWWNGDGDINGPGSLGRLGASLARAGAGIKTPHDLSFGVTIDGATVSVLHPIEPGFEGNDASVVLLIEYGKVILLFTGDIGQAAEAAIERRLPRIDVLKVAHHGSRYSTGEGFLRAAAPAVAVISAGRSNPFGFPHAQTLDRLTRAGARVFRTDLDGAVTVTTDGRAIEVQSALAVRPSGLASLEERVGPETAP